MASESGASAPSAVFVPCPDCGEETLHTVLKGRVSERGGYTLDATVKCTECARVHHTVVREAADRDLPVIVSEEDRSHRSIMTIPGDDELSVGDLLTVEERPVRVTALELPDGRRVQSADAQDLQTVWAQVHDRQTVKFSINMGKKTISKELEAQPEDEVTVGNEYTFGRLRVTVHAIKTERLLKRGSAEAADIRRVFARPTPPDRKPYRPPKAEREAQARAEREARGWRAEEDAPPARPSRSGGTRGGGARGGGRGRGGGGSARGGGGGGPRHRGR